MKLRYLISFFVLLTLPLLSSEKKAASGNASTSNREAVAESHENVIDEILENFKGLVDNFLAVKDEASANEAIEYINILPAKLKALVEKAESMEAPDEETANSISKKVDKKLKKMMDEMMKNGKDVSQDNFQKVIIAFQNISGKIESLVDRLDEIYPLPEGQQVNLEFDQNIPIDPDLLGEWDGVEDKGAKGEYVKGYFIFQKANAYHYSIFYFRDSKDQEPHAAYLGELVDYAGDRFLQLVPVSINKSKVIEPFVYLIKFELKDQDYLDAQILAVPTESIEGENKLLGQFNTSRAEFRPLGISGSPFKGQGDFLRRSVLQRNALWKDLSKNLCGYWFGSAHRTNNSLSHVFFELLPSEGFNFLVIDSDDLFFMSGIWQFLEPKDLSLKITSYSALVDGRLHQDSDLSHTVRHFSIPIKRLQDYQRKVKLNLLDYRDFSIETFWLQRTSKVPSMFLEKFRHLKGKQSAIESRKNTTPSPYTIDKMSAKELEMANMVPFLLQNIIGDN